MTATISGTSGVTFPAGGLGNTAGAVVGISDTQTLTNKTLSTGLVMGASAITSGTAIVRKEGRELVMTKDTQPVNLTANEWHEIEALEDGTVFVNVFAEGKY